MTLSRGIFHGFSFIIFFEKSNIFFKNLLTNNKNRGIIVSQSRERVATETITTPSDEIHSRAERRRKLKRGQNVKRDKRSLWGHDSLAVIKGAATHKPQKVKDNV